MALEWTRTGWRRCIGCLKLQVSFFKRASNYRALLRKMTSKDKASYGSSQSGVCVFPCACPRVVEEREKEGEIQREREKEGGTKRERGKEGETKREGKKGEETQREREKGDRGRERE